MSLGYNADKTEYTAPCHVSILHEDSPINSLLAGCVMSSQSSLISANIDEAAIVDTFEYHTRILIVCSQRFSADMFRQLSARGFQEIYLVSRDSLVEYNRKYYAELSPINADIPIDFKCLSYEEILDYVKMLGNAYSLYDDYLAIMGDSENKAKISMKLKFIERGLTADGTPLKDAFAKLCGKINYHSLLDLVLAKGRAYFDIGEAEANEAISQCRIITTLEGKKYALIHSTKLSNEALINLAPMSEKIAATSAIIYAEYEFSRLTWKLCCISNGGSAYDCLKDYLGVDAEVEGSFSLSRGETTTLCG